MNANLLQGLEAGLPPFLPRASCRPMLVLLIVSLTVRRMPHIRLTCGLARYFPSKPAAWWGSILPTPWSAQPLYTFTLTPPLLENKPLAHVLPQSYNRDAF
jgi:hypothetical protein